MISPEPTNGQKHKVLYILIGIIFCLSSIENSYAQSNNLSSSESGIEVNPSPDVIPGLREWQGSVGFCDITANIRIVAEESSLDVLKKSLKVFASDIRFFLGRDMEVVAGSENISGIFVALDSDSTLGPEGYIIKIDDGIRLTAYSQGGIFMGTRTILQLLNLYGNRIPRGQARDYPMYERRGFMLDVGRKFFRLEFLEDYIRMMSYYKMNEFHVHLNDNGFKQFFDNDWSKTYSAFRLESDTYPGLTAADGFYTKEEFTQLQQLGVDYGVNVIPEIDVPAHSLAFTKYNPSIGSEKYGMDHLDISKQETYDFLDKLFEEYLGGENPVFIGPDVHIGTDEYDKKEAESFRKFTDYYLKKVQSYGKRARLWGALTHAAGSTPVTSENVIMNAWYNGYADPKDMIDQGFELISTSDRHLYIVPAAGYYYDYLNLEFLYNKWGPHLIGGDTFQIKHPQISGGMFAVWNDHCGNGISEKDVHHRAFPALQVLAQKMWFGEETGRLYEDFSLSADKLIEAPFVNQMGKIDHIGSSVLYYDFRENANTDLSQNDFNLLSSNKTRWKEGEGYKFRKNHTITSPLEEIGYPYELVFDITFKKKNKEAVVFSSKNAQVVVNQKDRKIELGFKRDGYYYKFSYLLEADKYLSLGIKGDNRGTSLYVDGKEVERLEGIVKEYWKEDGRQSNMYIQQTLVFPLKEIGNFNGLLHNLKVISE